MGLGSGTVRKIGGEEGRGLGAWLVETLRGRRRAEPRLALLERISLAPRQSLALVEAEGQRILVATSTDGGQAFFPLDGSCGVRPRAATNSASKARSRTSW